MSKSIAVLPNELLVCILQWLDMEELASLYLTNRHFQVLVVDPALWKKFETHYTWNTTKGNSSIIVKGLQVERGANSRRGNSFDWCSICSQQALDPKRTHYLEFKVENLIVDSHNNNWSTVVGIQPTFAEDCKTLWRVHSFGFVLGKGTKVGRNAQDDAPYTNTPCVKGNVVGMLYDAPGGKLFFARNGKWLGAAFTDIPTTKDSLFFVTVAMYYQGNKVSLCIHPERSIKSIVSYKSRLNAF